MLGTELGLTELRLVMRRLRSHVEQNAPPPATSSAPTKKEVILEVRHETNWHVPTALNELEARGMQVDRSYVYEIKRIRLQALQEQEA